MKTLSYIITAFLFFCTNAAAENIPQLEHVSLQLRWADAFQFAGFYVAKEKGFYAEVGLDVEIKLYETGYKITEEVLSNRSQYGVSNSLGILRRGYNDKIVLLMPILQHSPLVFLTLKSSGISKIEDLKHKKIMTSLNVANEPSLMCMLQSKGISPDDITKVPMTFDLAPLINNEVDAYSAYISNQPYHLKEQGIEYNIINPIEYGFDFYGDTLITSEFEMYSHPDRVRRFVAASKKGWLYAFEHIEETVSLLLERHNSQNLSREALLYEAKKLRELSGIDRGEFGLLSESKVENIANMYLLLGESLNKENLKGGVFDPEQIFLQQDEFQYLSRKKEINICLNSDNMPYEGYINNEFKGLSYRLFRLIEEKINLPFHLVRALNHKQSTEFLRQGLCDIQLFATEDDNTTANFSTLTTPYFQAPLVVAGKKNERFLTDLSTLSSQMIGFLANSVLEKTLKAHYPKLDFVGVLSIDQGLKMVQDGTLYGVVGTVDTIEFANSNYSANTLKIIASLPITQDIAIAVRNDEPILLSIFNKAISALNHDKKISIFSSSPEIIYHKVYDYGLVVKILLTVLLITILAVIQYSTLKKHAQQLEKLATTDKLTGLYNRLRLDEEMEKSFMLFKRHQTYFSLIVIDVDHFKLVNDQYGHQVGDSILIKLSGALLRSIRETDIIGRWGGEEFIILCSNTNQVGARELAEKLRSTIQTTSFPPVGSITISCGVAQVDNEKHLKDVIKRADDALYLAKQGGRNKIVVSSC